VNVTGLALTLGLDLVPPPGNLFLDRFRKGGLARVGKKFMADLTRSGYPVNVVPEDLNFAISEW
jgi:hypothetical protein